MAQTTESANGGERARTRDVEKERVLIKYLVHLGIKVVISMLKGWPQVI